MLKNITLEMSLKPFKQTDSAYIQKICRKVFEQWKMLLHDTDTISILMWSADGSELLDYRGNLNDSFEWAYYIGGANQREKSHIDSDPEGLGLHTRNYLYMDNPPVMTYNILKEIIDTLKRTGKEYFPSKTIRVGTTVDPGPEFAVSSFKYERHNEICTGNEMGKATMVCAYAKLNGDKVSYAGFPNGIPDGLPFGTFFGRQAQVFMKDIGFDYIWLSNGLGFGRETWSTIGATFDGTRFDSSAIEDIKKDVTDFWSLFRAECPDYPIEVRGTNMSMGIDFATDAVPLKTIYDNVTKLLPPPNSPWAALNFDFGLELMGYMSRIANVPNDEYLFRYYIHDPWWMNSPWYDRYNSQPHDIYLPLSISRIDENGNIKPPTHMNFLTIDNSHGDMPDSCVNEPVPHLLKALKEVPDEASPVVWVYPFDEYSSSSDEQAMSEMFAGDWFIRGAINSGAPISTVVSTNNFLKHDKSLYSSSILITPVPEKESKFESHILSYAQNGGKVIFYGNTIRASEKFLNAFNLKNTDEISGELNVTADGKPQGIIKHNPLVCGGGLCTEAKDAFASADGKALGAIYKNSVWLRGTVSCDYTIGHQLLTPHSPEKYFIGETLILSALEKLGLHIKFETHVNEQLPVIMLHRHDNAFIFSAFLKSTTVKTKLKLPLGAPVLDGYETVIEDGYASYNFPKAEHRECRVFVEQQNGIVGCREIPPVSYQIRRRIEVFGLKNAVVRVLAENYCKDSCEVILNAKHGGDCFFVGDDFDGSFVTKDGLTYYEARNVTGSFVFSMPTKK